MSDFEFKNKILHGNNLEVIKQFDDNCIDMILTSPPYDDLREYESVIHQYDFHNIAKQLYRVLKDGSVMVWIVGDKTENGDESGNSFRQALYFKDIGFKLHDTMIYQKNNVSFPDPLENRKRYHHCFDYMFILLKGKKVKKWNPLIDRKLKIQKGIGREMKYTPHARKPDGKQVWSRDINWKEQEFGPRFNIWSYFTGFKHSTNDNIAFEHPAIMPEKLAQDHIISWSNNEDIILDPFMGSGTTAKMALLNNRNFVGIEINQKYIDIAMKRIEGYLLQEKLSSFMP